jgi:hypothetical protein
MSGDNEFEKEVDIEFDFDFESDVDVEFDKDVDVDIDVKSDVDLEGNFAQATFSAEAIGSDTIAEADVHVLVIEGKLSSVDGSLLAATE